MPKPGEFAVGEVFGGAEIPAEQLFAGAGDWWSGDSDEGGPGASYAQRALASFKSSPAGRRNFYATKYGVDNVRLDGDEVQIYQGGRWGRADPKGIDVGDIFDLVGDVPEVVLSAIGATIGAGAGVVAGAPTGPGAVATGGLGAVAGAGAGAATGNVLKQTIGALINGDDELTAGERLWETGKAGMFGAGGQKVASMLMQPVTRLISTGRIPAGLSGWLMKRAEAKAGQDVLDEAAKIEAAIPGVNLDPGSRTLDPTLLRVQQGLDAVPFSADLWKTTREMNLEAMTKAYDDILARVSAYAPDNNAMGYELKQLRDKIVDEAYKTRGAQAKADFDLVRNATDNAAIIDPHQVRSALTQEMRSLTDMNGIPLAGMEKAVEDLFKFSEKFTQPLDLVAVQNYLQAWGKAGYGQGVKTFDSLHLGAEQQMKRNLHRALLGDLDDAAAQVPMQNAGATKLATALQNARNHYQAASEVIERHESGALHRIVGKLDEGNYYQIGEKFLNLKPEARNEVLGMAAIGGDPLQRKLLVRGILENVLNKSTVRTKAGTGESQFSIARFLQNLPPEKDLNALLGDPQAAQQIKMIAAGLRRIEAKGFAGQSPTAEKILNWGSVGVGLGAILNPALAAKVGAAIFGSRQMSKHLLTPQGRNALNVLLTPTNEYRVLPNGVRQQVTPERARQAILYLMADYAAGEPDAQK